MQAVNVLALPKMHTHKNGHINVEMYDECYSLAFKWFNNNTKQFTIVSIGCMQNDESQDLSAANLLIKKKYSGD